ncbi:MAG: tetratricopeptide repeat protein [Verrucomicrobiae bacterium]|nr:tetratricopeptide repeat protein [Verrucomicrobiae bacterium]
MKLVGHSWCRNLALVVFGLGAGMCCAAPGVVSGDASVVATKKADDLLARGRYAEAFTLYEEMEKKAAGDEALATRIRFQQGLCRLKAKRTPDAFSIWTRMRSLAPTSIYAPRSLLFEAEDPTNTGKQERLYDEILEKYPKSEEAATVLRKRGQVAFDHKDYRKAVDCWEQFLSGFLTHPQAAAVREKLQTAQLAAGGDTGAAGEAAAGNLLKRANALFDKASFAEALRLYQEVLGKYALSKEAGHASGRLAQCQQALGKDKEALQTLQRMVEKNPESAAEALGEIVIHATNAKMEALRQRATQELLNKYPTAFETQQAIFIAGSQAMGRKNRAEAERWWNMLLEKYPQTEFRASVERSLGLSAEGNPTLTRNAGPTPVLSKEDLQRKKLEDQKIWEREAGDFERKYRDLSLSKDERAENAYQLGERLFFLGQHEKAVARYQRVWEEFPQSVWADQAIFRAAQVCFAARQPQKGVEHFLLLVNQCPQSNLRPFVLFCLGNRHVLYEGDLKKAWPYYDQLMKEYPDSALAGRARKYWAQLSKLPEQKLKEQVDVLLKREKAAEKKSS